MYIKALDQIDLKGICRQFVSVNDWHRHLFQNKEYYRIEKKMKSYTETGRPTKYKNVYVGYKNAGILVTGLSFPLPNNFQSF